MRPPKLPRPMQRSERQFVGGVRLVTAPVVETFDQTMEDNVDEKGGDMDSNAGSQLLRAASNAGSPTPYEENGIGSDDEMGGMDVSQQLQFTRPREQSEEQIDRPTGMGTGTVPTRDQALAFFHNELAAYNHNKQYEPQPRPTRLQPRTRLGKFTTPKPAKTPASYAPFTAPYLAAKIAKSTMFSNMPQTSTNGVQHREQDGKDITMADASTSQAQIIHEVKRNGVPNPSPLNIAELIATLQGETGYPAVLSLDQIRRFRPWDSLEFCEHLPSINFIPAFRLKLDLFTEVMDWLNLKTVFGIQREASLTILKDALIAAVWRAELTGPVNVLVRNIRVGKVIQEIKNRFSATIIKALDAGMRGIAGGVGFYTEPLSTDMLVKMKELLEDQEYGFCLLAWLWCLEEVPERYLKDVDIDNVRWVFREEDDWTTEPTGAVVLLSE